jgi:glycine/D-amino acid oxidase-like deaminating enzyme
MRSALYDPDITDTTVQQDTYWRATAGGHVLVAPLTHDVDADVCVIGGGYCGLSAAHRLASRHGLAVCVAEAGQEIGWGASGLNGGFVSAGGTMLEAAQILRRVGVEDARRFAASQAQAVDDLRAVIRDHAISCDVTGDGNLCVAHSPRAAAVMQAEAEAARHSGADVEWIDADRFRREVHDGPETFGALRQRPAFGVHPLKLVRGIARIAQTAGVRIATGAQIVSWTREGSTHVLHASCGAVIRAGRVVVAANAYLRNGLRRTLDNRALPAISSIIVTQPYSAPEHAARGFLDETPIYNARYLLYYYRRLPDGRILFGERGDIDGTREAAARRATLALSDLKRILPAFADARIDYAWRGLVCLTARRTLAVGLDREDGSVAFAFGCHGSGVATMSWAGRQCADLVMGASKESDLPTLVRGLPPRLPPSPTLQRAALAASYRFFQWQDRD